MKRFLIVILILLFSAINALPAFPALSQKRSVKVLIVDGYSNHDWAYSTEVLTSLLVGSGAGSVSVDISTAPMKDTHGYEKWRPDFSNYDVVIQNCNSLGNDNYWPERVQKDFENYMRNGGGLYVFHSGNNSFEKWEEYNKMIGLGWRKADGGDAVEIVDGKIQRIPSGNGAKTSHGKRRDIVVELLEDHPINQGYPVKWMTPDIELYVYARGPAENLKVLSYTYDSITDKNWPVDWVVEYGKGKVYNATTGHLWHDLRMPESIQCVGFQTTFIRTIQWLADQKVSKRIPKNFPGPTEISLQAFDLIYRDVDGWERLYNEKDLDGWHVECLPQDREKIYWTAKGEYIECNSMTRPEHNYYWLVSDGEYGDFQLRLEFQVFSNSTGNSGIQFRSRFNDSDKKSSGGWLNGPQVDIHPPWSVRCGLIYDETRGVQRWIYPSLPNSKIVLDQAPKTARNTKLVYADDDPDAWNSLEIICQGMQIRTFVNGKRVTKFDASGILDDEIHEALNVGKDGHIALQLHSKDELLIRYRNMYIRSLNFTLSNK